MLDIIAKNPFRILGVYSDSGLRDIVANRNRINAFAKVGKPCAFPTDLASLAGPVDRTPESVQAADSALTIDADKLKYATFWLMKGEPADADALRMASEGNVAGALASLESRATMASLQNLAVISLMRNDIRKASVAFANVTDRYAANFYSAIGLNAGGADTLVDTYVKTLLENDSSIDAAVFTGNDYPASWNATVKDVAAAPVISQLEALIAEARKSKDGSPVERLNAGMNLSKKSKPLLMKLRNMLTTKDLKLVNISDKVGNEVLQCGIDFYNNSDDISTAKDALALAKDARMIVLGSMARQRCDENIKTLESNAALIPSAAISADVNAVSVALNDFTSHTQSLDSLISLLDLVEPHLKKMKETVGENDPIYINWSTNVVNVALNLIIDKVNAAQKEASNGSKQLQNYITYVAMAKGFMNRLSKYNMDQACRNRFNTNNNTLNELYAQTKNVNTSGGDSDSGFSSCFIQILIYLGIMALVAMCSQ